MTADWNTHTQGQHAAEEAAQSETTNAEASNADNSDLKAKMRAALDRKSEREHRTEHAVEPEGTEKMHGVQGHVDTQNYRRKSGGGGA